MKEVQANESLALDYFITFLSLSLLGFQCKWNNFSGNQDNLRMIPVGHISSNETW